MFHFYQKNGRHWLHARVIFTSYSIGLFRVGTRHEWSVFSYSLFSYCEKKRMQHVRSAYSSNIIVDNIIAHNYASTHVTVIIHSTIFYKNSACAKFVTMKWVQLFILKTNKCYKILKVRLSEILLHTLGFWHKSYTISKWEIISNYTVECKTIIN